MAVTQNDASTPVQVPAGQNWKCQCGFDNRPTNLICGGANQQYGCGTPRPGVQVNPNLVEAKQITDQLQQYLQQFAPPNVGNLSAEALNSVFEGLKAILGKVIESQGQNVQGQSLQQVVQVIAQAKLFSENQSKFIEAHIIACATAMKDNPNITLSDEQKGIILKTIFSTMANIGQRILPWVANGCNGKPPGEQQGWGRKRWGRGGRRRGRGRGGRRGPPKPPPGAPSDPNDPNFDLCWAFVRGKCKRGQSCKWRHGQPAPGTVLNIGAPQGNVCAPAGGQQNNAFSQLQNMVSTPQNKPNDTPSIFGNMSNAL